MVTNRSESLSSLVSLCFTYVLKYVSALKQIVNLICIRYLLVIEKREQEKVNVKLNKCNNDTLRLKSVPVFFFVHPNFFENLLSIYPL